MTDNPLALVQRIQNHLANMKRQALADNDSCTVCACRDGIRELEAIVRSLRAEAYLQRRKRRAEVLTLRTKNESNVRLQNRLAETEGRFPSLSIAA